MTTLTEYSKLMTYKSFLVGEFIDLHEGGLEMKVHIIFKKWYGIIIFILLTTWIASFLTGCVSNDSTSKNPKETLTSESAPNYWPTEGWKSSTPEAQGMDSAQIAAMFDTIKTFNYDVHHIQVIRNGYTVAECHYGPYQPEDPQIVYSITKSVTSALIGKAVEEGYIKSIDDKVLSYFPNNPIKNASPYKSAMTIKDLLTMRTGIKWVENGDYSNPNNSTALFHSSENPIQYMLDLPVLEAPGKTFNYSTGAAHLLSGILTEATHKSAETYAKEKLWGPLGIQSAYWGADNQNISEGGSRSFYTAGDLAKIGYLFLNNGNWDGQQVLSKEWVKESTKVQVETPYGPAGYNGYGYLWWKNPFEGYSARGYGGQYLFVLPETNMVVVFMGNFNSSFFKPESMVKSYLIPACISDGAIKENPESQKLLSDLIAEGEKPEETLPVSELPQIVESTKGKVFDVDNGGTVGIDFEKGNDTATLHWYVDGFQYDVPVGLDNVYRFSDCQDFFLKDKLSRVGFRGTWKDDKTFEIEVLATEAERGYVLTLEFSKGVIVATFE